MVLVKKKNSPTKSRNLNLFTNKLRYLLRPFFGAIRFTRFKIQKWICCTFFIATKWMCPSFYCVRDFLVLTSTNMFVERYTAIALYILKQNLIWSLTFIPGSQSSNFSTIVQGIVWPCRIDLEVNVKSSYSSCPTCVFNSKPKRFRADFSLFCPEHFSVTTVCSFLKLCSNIAYGE